MASLLRVQFQEVHRSGRKLGYGRYGCVIEKVYVRRDVQEYAYACKIYETEFKNDDFQKEFKIQFDKYHELQHRNLLEIKGVCDTGDSKIPWVLFELMEANLFQRISGNSAEKLPMSVSLHILTEILDGLKFLHEKDIVHKSLSSSSILVNDQNHVKICGFPFIPVEPDQAISDKQAFMAPEVISNNQYDKSTDMYSFACITLHLMSKELPKLPKNPEGSGPGDDIHALVQNYFRNVPVPSALQQKIVEPCLSNMPMNRPTVDVVNKTMADITNDHNKNKEESRQKAPVVVKSNLSIQDKDPVTIPNFYVEMFSRCSDNPALYWKDKMEDPWQHLSYIQYKKLIYNVSKSFVKLGLKPQQSVAIQGFNSVEWFASYIGAIFAGGMSAGIHISCSSETCRYILKDCKATVAVVGNQMLLNQIIKIQDHLPHLKAIILYKGELSQDYPDIRTYTWSKFLEIGKDTEDSEIDTIIKKQQPDQCAVLVYTSGTTGNPKGVMLSHDNLTWITAAIMDTLDYDLAKDVLSCVVSYLPLAHIAGMLTDMILPTTVGGAVYFAPQEAQKGPLLINLLKKVQPTVFLGVPRLWDQIKDKLSEVSRAEPNCPTADIKEMLGLSKCLYIYSAAASMCRETLTFFEKLGITVLELYGLCECTGPHTVSLKGHGQKRWKRESCGKGLNGTQTRIINRNDYDDSKLLQIKCKYPVGEVIFRGRHIFMGYFERDNELVDNQGWLHSGDIGWVDNDGYLYIKCRIEDLITMENGIKVSPLEIEDCIKNKIPFLSNVMLIGDKRKYLTCLMTLKCIIDPNTGEAKDDLQPLVKTKFKELGTNCTKVSQVLSSKDKEVFKAIQDGIDSYNNNQINNNAMLKVHDFALLNTDFTIPGGALGPTYKLKRSEVERMFNKEIEELYKDDGLLITLEEHCVLRDPQTVSATVGYYGAQIIIKEHNITITIPKGAIEKGYTVEIKAAASFFAAFSFPKECHCISAYLWIGASYDFKKPLKVEMEHHAAISLQKHLSELCVMEGQRKKDDFGYNYVMCEVNGNAQCQFEIDSPRCTYFTKSKYACLVSKDRKMADKVAVYYFLPRSYESDDRFTTIFCLCYNLKFCKQATENMYEEQGMCKRNCDILNICYDEELCFQTVCKKKEGDCEVLNDGKNKINPNQINLRKFKNEEDIKEAHENNLYPPCFKASIHHYTPSCLLDVQFVVSVTKNIETYFNLFLERHIPSKTPEAHSPVEEVGSDPRTFEIHEVQDQNHLHQPY